MLAAAATLDRAAIEERLPHRGAMVLLDRVIGWDERAIDCATETHRAADNPLRHGGTLPALAGVEYAAQAMAVHGALIAQEAGRPGVLASLRRVVCHVARLDDIAEVMAVRAEVMIADRDRSIYGFRLRAGSRPLLEGQAAVFLL